MQYIYGYILGCMIWLGLKKVKLQLLKEISWWQILIVHLLKIFIVHVYQSSNNIV
jgi:hypothetical protein